MKDEPLSTGHCPLPTICYNPPMHAKRRPIALLLLLLLLAACAPAPQPAPGPNPDLSDPNVGGGAGEALGPETPIPTPTITREPSPRLDPAAAATTDGRPPTAAPLATATPFVLATPQPPPATATPEPPAAATATPAASPTAAGERIHIVQPGENLYRIGLQYGLSWVAIAEYNGITNPDAISAGQELRIPPSPTATAESATDLQTTDEAQGSGGAGEQGSRGDGEAATDSGPVVADEPPAGQDDGPPVVAVAAGDTLYGISQQYGIDWAQIAEANGLATPNQLYPGQLLKIPPDVAGPTPAFSHRVHTGETLSELARQYGLSAGELAEANGLAAPYTIYSGQTLVIPSEE